MSIETNKIFFEQIPKDKIKIELSLTPKKMELKSIGPDKDRERGYTALITEAGFREPLKIGRLNNENYLIDNYELYRAYNDFYYNKPNATIPCLVVERNSLKELKFLVMRLAKLRGEKELSPIFRLSEALLLSLIEITPRERRSLMSMGNNAADRKKSERDWRLIRNRKFLSRVLGISVEELNMHTIESIICPRPNKATLSYGQAIRLLEILPDDDNVQEKFLKAMDEMLLKIDTSYTSPEEKTLPIHQRKNFSFGNLQAIAKSIAIGDGYCALNDNDLVDQKINVVYSDITGDLHLDELNINLHDTKNPANLKLLVDAVFKVGIVYETLAAHLNRIKPTEHGELTKISGPETVLKFVYSSNKPKLEERIYNDQILKNKTIATCNREYFLKCIGLRAQDFGFQSSDYNAVSTFSKARHSFEEFYKKFLNDVFKYYANDLRNHPFNDYYPKINNYLEKKAPTLIDSTSNSDSSESILFCNFFLNLFIEVHAKMEREIQERRARIEEIEKQDRKLDQINKDEIDRLLKRIDKEGEVVVSKIQLEAIVHSRVATRENKITGIINTQNHIMEQLLSEKIGRRPAVQKGSPLTLTDFRSPRNGLKHD